jgi:ABC-type multidrug transport system ATPase subunit
LFLDEPTSGLDAESALQVMTFLKKYARAGAGRRVILTIHQPGTMIWQLIDNVVLLSKGKLMYQGSRTAMEEYFASIGCPTELGWNPADHYITLVNDDFRDSIKTVDEWAECFNKYEATQMSESENKRRGKSRTPSMLKASGLIQIETKRSSSMFVVIELTYRYFLNLWFNPGILGTRLAMYTMLGKCTRFPLRPRILFRRPSHLLTCIN